MKALRFVVFAIGLGLVVPCGAEDPKARLDQLAFMTGAWQGPDGDAQVEEHWIAPKGGLMLGVNRTVSGGRAVEFEFLRIEQQGDSVVYLASPGGRPATPFKLVEGGEGRAVFENPDHDFPRRVSYRLNPDGSLTARIEGTRGGKPVSKEWTWHRAGN